MNHSLTSAPLAERFEPRSETETRLHGYWLVLVRLVCLTLSVLSVGLFVVAILSVIANSGQLTPGDVRRLHELGLSKDFYVTYTNVIMSISALGYWLVAAFLFWRKSDDRLALLAAVSLALFPMVFNDGLINRLPSPWWFLAHVLSVLGFLCLLLFFYVFPSGHFVPSFTRWVLVVALLFWGFDAFFPSSSFNPFSLSQVLGGLIFLGLLVGVVVAQIYRYRWVSSPAQRQQTKWVVYGMSMGGGGYLVLFTIALFFPSLFSTGSLGNLIKLTAAYGLVLLTPLSIGLAILRSRLLGYRRPHQPHVGLRHPLRLRRRGVRAGGGIPGRTHWDQRQSGDLTGSNWPGCCLVPTLARMGAAGGESPALRPARRTLYRHHAVEPALGGDAGSRCRVVDHCGDRSSGAQVAVCGHSTEARGHLPALGKCRRARGRAADPAVSLPERRHWSNASCPTHAR